MSKETEALREKIAERIFNWYKGYVDIREGLWQKEYESIKETFYKRADEIFQAFKEAGWLSHSEVQSMLNTLSGGLPEIAKIQGYVQLDPDQSLPAEHTREPRDDIERMGKGLAIAAQKVMLRANFRKIKVE